MVVGQQLEIEDGTYTFEIAFDEWDGKSLGSSCQVTIKGDSITVINDGSLSGIKGKTIEKGILKKHKTGVWIISTSEEDVNADEIGGCTDGPSVIELKNRKLRMC